MNPVERLLNLLALLVETRRPLSFEQIRERLGAYTQPDRESAKRQFERDKDALRAIGVPVEVAPIDVWETEDGYRIRKELFQLPEIDFTTEEVAALFVAAHAGEGGEASDAFRKLALGAPSGLLPPPGTVAGPAGSEDAPAPEHVADLVSRRRRVRFSYRPSRGEASDRDVDAWAVVYRRGSWYLVGNDRDREETRAFRLSRIEGAIEDLGEGLRRPEGFDASEHVQAGPWGVGEPDTTARIALSPKVSWWAVAGVPGAEVDDARDDGWVEAEVPAGGPAFISWLLSFGPDAEALAPEELRLAVVRRLEALLATG